MENMITLKDAFRACEEFKQQTETETEHLNDFELNSISGKSSWKENERAIEHLISCAICSQKLNNLLETEPREIMETAWRKAAASTKIHWPQKLKSRNGTFSIDIRESESRINSGLIVVQVNENKRKRVEGKRLSVVDGKGHILLEGVIRNGRVFQRIDNLNSIDLRLMIRTHE
ncbi:MAG: hypothetical protein GWP06_05445 [Actinobacteria bacterium]|nr:hypothetical protein [Actinomycetota bacterium]